MCDRWKPLNAKWLRLYLNVISIRIKKIDNLGNMEMDLKSVSIMGISA